MGLYVLFESQAFYIVYLLSVCSCTIRVKFAIRTNTRVISKLRNYGPSPDMERAIPSVTVLTDHPILAPGIYSGWVWRGNFWFHASGVWWVADGPHIRNLFDGRWWAPWRPAAAGGA